MQENKNKNITKYFSNAILPFASGGIVPPKNDEDKMQVLLERGWWQCKKCGAIFDDCAKSPVNHVCVANNINNVELFANAETILQRIASGGPLPGHGATIDALRALCAEPSKSNICLALRIAQRAEISIGKLGSKAGEVRRKLRE